MKDLLNLGHAHTLRYNKRLGLGENQWRPERRELLFQALYDLHTENVIVIMPYNCKIGQLLQQALRISNGHVFGLHASRMAKLGKGRVSSRIESTLLSATQALVENQPCLMAGGWHGKARVATTLLQHCRQMSRFTLGCLRLCGSNARS